MGSTASLSVFGAVVTAFTGVAAAVRRSDSASDIASRVKAQASLPSPQVTLRASGVRRRQETSRHLAWQCERRAQTQVCTRQT